MTSRAMRRANERRTAKAERRSQVRARTLAAGATVALGASVIYVPPAEAATLQVTNTNDSGPGSLRSAVETASADVDPDTITFAPSVTGTIDLTSGQISATGNIAIEGPGSDELTIDAGGQSRVFQFSTAYYGGDDVVVSGLTLTGGESDQGGYYSTLDGGAVFLNRVDAELADVVVTDSHARRGGGIAARSSSVTLTDVAITGNSAFREGGGLRLRSGDLTVTGSVISGNHTDGSGGGVLLYDLYGGATIADSLISDNDAEGTGGGLSLKSYYGVDFSTTVVNTTIAENHADGHGGGVFLSDQDDDVVQTFTSVTIAGNTSPTVGGIAAGAGPKVLRNSIVADNTKRDLRLVSSDDPFVLDFSLVENYGATPIVQETPDASILGIDPDLGALDDNGGPQATVAPTAESPVVDQGNSFDVETDQRGEARPVDRLGDPAPADGADMGAVELQGDESPAPNPDPAPEPEDDPAPVVTNRNDAGPGSLRAAVATAAELPGPDTVTFEPSVTGTIELTSGAIVSDDREQVTIDGPGADVLAVDAGGTSGVLAFGSYDGYGSINGSVTVSGITLTDGHARQYNAPYTYEGHFYPGGWRDRDGGALFVDATDLTLDGVVITDSRGRRGGGLFVRRGEVSINDSVITGNQSSGDGGGVYVRSSSDAAISGTTLQDNDAGGHGGGLHVEWASAFGLTTSTITGNSAVKGGGGLQLRSIGGYDDYHRPSVIAHSLISGNSTDGLGGGLALSTWSGYYESGTPSANASRLEVEASTITDNRAVIAGGGVYLGPQASGFVVTSGQLSTPEVFTNSTIAGNSADQGGGIAAASGEKVIQGSIVADNAGGDLRLLSSTDPFTLDHSLVESGGSTPVEHTTAGSNLLGVDPQLGPLADNGGRTLTMAPSSGSPVIDQGKAYGSTSDQRGLPRPVDGPGAAAADASDMGAVEAQTGSVVAGVPSAPQLHGGDRGDGELWVRWHESLSDGGSAITGYLVQARSGDGPWTTVETAEAGTTDVRIDGLTNNTKYALRVIATNARGDSAPSSTYWNTPVSSSSTRPQPPGIGTVTPADGAVTVTWIPPGNDGGAPILDYEVEWTADVDDWYRSIRVGASTRSVTIPGLSNGTTYSFRVRAINTLGVGDPSSVLTATPTAAVVTPTPPAVTPPVQPAPPVPAPPAATALPALPKPKITGTPKAGKKIAVAFTLPAAAAGAKVTYSWTVVPAKKGKNKPKPIAAGKAKSLTLKKSWKGAKVTVTVTVTKTGVPSKKVTASVKVR